MQVILKFTSGFVWGAFMMLAAVALMDFLLLFMLWDFGAVEGFIRFQWEMFLRVAIAVGILSGLVAAIFDK